jgi:O-antigen ligase
MSTLHHSRGSERLLADERAQKKISILGGLWIVVVSLTPSLRLIQTIVGNEIVFAVLGLLVVTLVFGRVTRVYGGGWWISAAFLIVIAGLIAGQNSSIQASARVGLVFAVLIAVLPFVLRYFVTIERGWLRAAVSGFLIVQTLSAVAGLLQVTTGLTVFGFVANQGRANGLAAHPNVLGLMATFAVLLLLHLVLRLRGRIRALLVLALIANVAALLATGSLSNLLALGAGVLVLVVASRWATKFIALTIALVALLLSAGQFLSLNLSVLTAGLQGRVQSVTGQDDGEGSLFIRQQTWAGAWNRIQEDPFTGYGLDPMNASVYGPTVVHNYILHYWYQGGFAGLLFASIVTVLFLGIVIRGIVRAIDPVQAAVVAATVVYALTSAFYDQQYYWIPLMLAISASTPGGYALASSRDAPYASLTPAAVRSTKRLTRNENEHA